MTFHLTKMATLLDRITGDMYHCDMPDDAMNGLLTAHAAVVAEIINTPSVSVADRDAKRAAVHLLSTHPEADLWDSEIARIKGIPELMNA
jgi:hypothetical protein